VRRGSVRRTRRSRSTPATPSSAGLSDGRHAGTRNTQRMIDHDCVNNRPTCEPVRAPADVARVTCGRCVQKMVGGAVLPPPPLTEEQKKERFEKFLAVKRGEK
jgi:hypothetical protein